MPASSASVPACRTDATPETLQREAERAVLYGACLRVVRPDVRIKPQLVDAVAALLPAVQAFFLHQSTPLAHHALAYAQACGAEAFLLEKAHRYQAEHPPV